jgi:hypothetical protein
MVMRTIFSSCGDGLDGSGGRDMLKRLLPIWIGVTTRPQGNPHHPRARLRAASAAWLLIPQLRQDSWGALLHEVRTNMDQTRWLTWTSTGPEPLHFGQSP